MLITLVSSLVQEQNKKQRKVQSMTREERKALRAEKKKNKTGFFQEFNERTIKIIKNS